MKRKITKVLVTLLMLCMILPQTALAATTYYIDVTLSGPDAAGDPVEPVTASSSVYGTLNDKLASTVVGLINSKQTEIESKFAGTGLSAVFDAGMTAFNSSNPADWVKYVDNNTSAVSGSFKDILKDKNSTFADLVVVNQANEVTYTTGGKLYTVTVTLRQYTTGSSSSGGSSSGSSNATTETTKNPDGSTTTTTTNKTTGTVTEVTKEKDGTTTTVETKKDGTVTETVKTADGTTGTVVTDKSGDVTEAKAAVSTAAAKEAAKTGEAVTLPVEVPAATSTEDAPAIKVTVPKSAGTVKVEIPVEDVTPGTVAVIVKADGTEEIVATSVVTENGVALTLDGNATVKIIDNSKTFSDVPETNVFHDEISSLSARGIMIGKSDDKFDLYSSVTLDQIANVAGRITGAVKTSDFAGGVEWGKESGLETGNVAATRGNVLKALYVAAGSPAVEDTSILSRFNDASSISSDMAPMAAWAAQNGILKGNLDGTAGLGNNVTRGQACALAGRTMGVLA